MSAASLTEQRISLKDGRTLGFAEYGDPNGKPVLEFHGCPGSRLEAWYYDQAGKKLGARLIGIDRPGFGISSYAKGYRIADWPADVIELADALGLERFAVAGISSGSPYALACARFIPERLKGCAVVSGVPPLTVKGEKLHPSQFVMADELLMGRLTKTVPFAARAIFRYMLWQIRKDPANAMKQVKGAARCDIDLLKQDEMKRAFQQIVAESCRGGVKGPVDAIGLEMRDWGFSLPQISIQVSIWQGEAGYLVFPAAARYMASKLPNPKLHMIPGAGHITVIAERAEDVLRELLAAS
ncbi:MAG TPA: alpha/beta hydrolase [Xanthobacteraceae bacterium]|jgi:pimeloyl-ACP methyl ester carboxylesterase